MADAAHEEMVDDAPSTAAGDVEMGDGESVAREGTATAADGSELPFAEDGPEDPAPPRVSFVNYLATPIVTLLLGSGESETILMAHQGLLVRSPFFAEAVGEFADDGSVSPFDFPLRPNESVACRATRALTCVLSALTTAPSG